MVNRSDGVYIYKQIKLLQYQTFHLLIYVWVQMHENCRMSDIHVPTSKETFPSFTTYFMNKDKYFATVSFYTCSFPLDIYTVPKL